MITSKMKAFVVLVCFLFGGSVHSKTLSLHQRSTRSDICAATNVQIGQFGGGLMVTWVPTDSTACPEADSYRVRYEVHGEVKDIDAILGTGAVIEGVELSCNQIDIVVMTVDSSKTFLGETDTKTYNPTLPAVTLISVDQTDEGIALSWVQPDYAESCGLTYSVAYTFGTDEMSFDDIPNPSYLLEIPNMQSCDFVDISITAVSGVFRSLPIHIDFETGINTVEEFTLNIEDGAVAAEFKPPGNLGNCGVITYRVIQQQETCFRSTFTVKPVSDRGTVGQQSQNTIDKGPGQVLDLSSVVSGNNIVVRWGIPIGGEGCDLAYSVTYLNALVTTHAMEAELPSETKACQTDEITITPISGVYGVPTVISHKGELGMVSSFACNVNAPNMICTWNRPDDSESCSAITYSIRYSNGVTSGSTTTDQLTFTFAPQNCVNSWVYVEPQSGDTKGHGFERSFTEIDCQGL